jgi:hypothetical protein
VIDWEPGSESDWVLQVVATCRCDSERSSETLFWGVGETGWRDCCGKAWERILCELMCTVLFLWSVDGVCNLHTGIKKNPGGGEIF